MAPLAVLGLELGVAELLGADGGAVDGFAVLAPDAPGGCFAGVRKMEAQK